MDVDIDPLPIARDLWEEFQARGNGNPPEAANGTTSLSTKV